MNETRPSPPRTLDQAPIEEVLGEFGRWLADNKIYKHAYDQWVTMDSLDRPILYSTDQLVQKFLKQK